MEEVKTRQPLRERINHNPKSERSLTPSTPDKQSKLKKFKDLSKSSVEVIQIDSEDSLQNSPSRSQKPVKSSSNGPITHKDLPVLDADIVIDSEVESDGTGAEGEGTEEDQEGGSPDETMELDQTTEEQKENYEIISSSEEEQSELKMQPSRGPPKEVTERVSKRSVESSLDNTSGDEL